MLLPLGQRKFVEIVRYDRTTKEGLKITRISTRSCAPCRELPRAKRKRAKLDSDLEIARAQDPPTDCTQIAGALAACERRLLQLERHRKWVEHNNKYVTSIEDDISWNIRPNTSLVTMDYAKLYATSGRASKSCILTFCRPPSTSVLGHISLDYVDNWFRGASNGIAGCRILEYLFARTDIFKTEHIIFSGDTGNGFRGYEMFKFYSHCWSRYGKRVEHMSRCPRHAENHCDRHIAHIATKARAVMDRCGVFTLPEFANISRDIVATHAFFHDTGIDDVSTNGLDPSVHHPIANVAKPPGIKSITHAQFRWRVAGERYSEDGVCRVQEMIDGGPEKRNRWRVWCLDSTQPKLCGPCSDGTQKATRHEKKAKCPLLVEREKHLVVHGIRVIYCSVFC